MPLAQGRAAHHCCLIAPALRADDDALLPMGRQLTRLVLTPGSATPGACGAAARSPVPHVSTGRRRWAWRRRAVACIVTDGASCLPQRSYFSIPYLYASLTQVPLAARRRLACLAAARRRQQQPDAAERGTAVASGPVFPLGCPLACGWRPLCSLEATQAAAAAALPGR